MILKCALTFVWGYYMRRILQGKCSLLDRSGAQQSEVHSMSRLCTASLKLPLKDKKERNHYSSSLTELKERESDHEE